MERTGGRFDKRKALSCRRLLTNLETSTDKLLQIVLSGQPELEDKLRLPQLRQLRQRIMLRCKTAALTKEQTHEYIAERLRIAGADSQPIFTREAIDVVCLYSLGIPRVINLLCEHALVNAYAEQQRPILPKTVEEVAHEFQLDAVEPIAQTAPTPVDVFNSESLSNRTSAKRCRVSAWIRPRRQKGEGRTRPGPRFHLLQLGTRVSAKIRGGTPEKARTGLRNLSGLYSFTYFVLSPEIHEPHR